MSWSKRLNFRSTSPSSARWSWRHQQSSSYIYSNYQSPNLLTLTNRYFVHGIVSKANTNCRSCAIGWNASIRTAWSWRSTWSRRVTRPWKVCACLTGSSTWPGSWCLPSGSCARSSSCCTAWSGAKISPRNGWPPSCSPSASQSSVWTRWRYTQVLCFLWKYFFIYRLFIDHSP